MAVKKSEVKEGNHLPKALFDILACPLCKNDLKYSNDKKSLICVKCGKKYPIKDRIPILLPLP